MIDLQLDRCDNVFLGDKMNSVDKEINSLVTTLTSFIKDVAVTNVGEAKQKGLIKVEDAEVRKIMSIIGSSVDQALSRAYVQIEATKKTLRA